MISHFYAAVLKKRTDKLSFLLFWSSFV